MRELGLSEDELKELATTYWDIIEGKYPKAAQLQKLFSWLVFVFSKLIVHNNQRLAEQLNQSLAAGPRVEILSSVEADLPVAISGIGLKETETSVKIFGEVQNLGSYYLEYVEIVAALYDAQNRVVDRGSDTVDLLLPNSKYVFEIRIYDPAPFVRYEVIANVSEI